MNPARRLAAWTLPRSFLVADLLTMAAERDGWRRRSKRAEDLARRALALAQRCVDDLADEQARCDSLVADWDELVNG